MNRWKSVLFAALAAVALEIVLWRLFGRFGHIGGDGPDAAGWAGLIVFFPAMFLADVVEGRLSMSGVADVNNLLVLIFAFFEFFLPFWFGIVIWKRSHVRKHA